MKLYFPEASNQTVDYNGYNNGIRIFQKALSDHIESDPRKADFRIYCNLPWYHRPSELKLHGLPVMAYTMYESTKLPAGWVKFLNDHVSVVLVPSVFCETVFKKSGVRGPIFVLPLGIDTEKIKPIPKSQMMGIYVFMWLGVALDMGGRKGVDVVIRAYKELRKEGKLGKDSRLILKYKPEKDALTGKKLVRDFSIDHVETNDGIIYIQRIMTDDEMKDLYAKIDCCVNPTHGEGFGLIPLEQMALGKPVIVPNWSMPYLKSNTFIGAEYDLKRSPVTWNHTHFSIGLSEAAFNFRGTEKAIQWLPRLVNELPDGRRVKVMHFPGMLPPPKVKTGSMVRAKIQNAFRSIQKKTGLHHRDGMRKMTFFQEDPGLDAHVRVESLKEKMLWCYQNRAQADDVGFLARQHVDHFWDLENIRNKYEEVSRKIETLKQRGEL